MRLPNKQCFSKLLKAYDNVKDDEIAIERIFEMYARDEEKHFMEDVFSAFADGGSGDFEADFKRAFYEHILSNLWMLRFGKEETQEKVDKLWEEFVESEKGPELSN